MKFSELNIISIDPSLRSTGVFYQLPEFNREMSKVISPSGDINIALGRIQESIINDMANDPDIWSKIALCIIEDVYLSTKTKSKEIVMVSGVIRATISNHCIPIIEINVNTWKSITGWKKLSKGITKKDTEAYCFRVAEFYGKHFKTTDEADAYMMYLAVCDIMEKPGRLTLAVEKIRKQIQEILK